MYKIIFLFSLSFSLFAGKAVARWDSDNKLGNIFFTPLVELIAKSKDETTTVKQASDNKPTSDALVTKNTTRNSSAYGMVRVFGGYIPQSDPDKEWPYIDNFSIDKK